MCKPKNRVLCPDCGREKILFETEKKAKLYIEYNWESIIDYKNKLRVYHCPACCGYHVSSKKYIGDNRSTERMINRYKKIKNDNVIDFDFYSLKDECLSKNFKTRDEFMEYARSVNVSNSKTIQRVISWFDLNYSFA